MIHIYECNLTLKEYAQRGTLNDFPSLGECPCCRAQVYLNGHGYYWRHAMEGDVVFRIPIRRLRCPHCRKTVSLLPDFLIPRFQNTLRQVMFALKNRVIRGVTVGVRQLTQFYVRRFFSQLNSIEIFFRDEGNRDPIPRQEKEKAIRLLGMISALGEATFLRRSTGHFRNNFMARFAH